VQKVSTSEDAGTEAQGATAAPPENTQIEALVKVLPRMARIFKSQWRGLRLTVPQMSMLMELQELAARQGGAHPSELADRFCLSSPAITAALDELVEKGYCIRTHSETDRRKVVVRPTPEGDAVLAEVQERATEGLRAMLSDWDQERLNRLLDALRDLDATTEAYLARGKS
jgi:DNA-binding MarR family transcriptional regulator